MPHILSYNTTISDFLYREATGAIEPRVTMTCRAKYSISQNANGTHNFSSVYVRATIDITNRLDRSSPIRQVTKKPEVPTGSGTDTRGANVQITLLNPDKYWAVTQTGAILDPDSITNAYIDVYLPLGGSEIKIYRGRVIGLPTEQRGKTIFTIRDAVADLIDIPVRWENISADQNTSVSETGILSVSAHTTASGLRFYDAYTYFSYDGTPVPAVSNSKGDAVALLDIDFTTPVLQSQEISQWEIEFLDAATYRLVGPNVPTVYGNVNNDLDFDFVKIPSSSWQILGDPTGAKITFHTCYTVSGNPVTIMKRLIEHGFLQTWGSEPTEPTYLPVDWPTFNRLEKEFAGVTVYVSETNKDRSVYNLGDQKPISVKNLVEWISEHIGSSLIVDDQGRISVTSIYKPPSKLIYDINSSMIESHSFTGNRKRFDLLNIRYGTDPISSGYNSETIFSDITVTEYDPTEDYDEGDVVKLNGIYWQNVVPNAAGSFIITNWVQFTPNTYNLNLRYFKTGASDIFVNALQCYYLPRIWSSYRQITCKVLTQFGITLRAGDVVRFDLDEQPARTFYAEIVKVSKVIAGEVSVTAQEIPEPSTAENWCEGDYCEGNYF